MKLLSTVDLTNGSTIDGSLIAKLADIPNSFTKFNINGNTIDSVAKDSTINLISNNGIEITSNNDTKIMSFSLKPATTESLGGIKSGESITVDSQGIVTINKDGHNHTIDTIDGLQDELDKRAKIVSSKTEIKVNDSLEYIVDELTPSTNSNFLVYVYFRVVNVSSKISIKLHYTDMSGSQTQVIIDNSTVTEIGSYSIAPIFINAASSPIKLTASCEFPDRLFISSSIIQS